MAKTKRKVKPGRALPPRFMLVCEGQTEKGYFQELNRLLRLAGVSVKAVQDEVSPMGIVRRAHEYIVGNPKRGIEGGQFDQVWAVFDWDEHTDEVSRACKQADEWGIQVALSNPCFDVWLIWHLEDYRRIGCLSKQTDAELQRIWRPYKKGADNPWLELWSGLHDASRRAREAEAMMIADGLAYPENRPTSDAHVLMEAIAGGWAVSRKAAGECPVG